MLTQHSLKSRLLACFAAGGLCLTSAGTTFANDCGCQASCESCSVASSDCSCGCKSTKKKHNCVYKALDMFAGGIEKLLKLDECGCNTSCCDGGCDATTCGAAHSSVHHHPHHTHSVPSHGHNHSQHHGHAAQPNPLSNRQINLSPMGPSQWPTHSPAPVMSEPAIVTTPNPGQHLGGGSVTKPEASAVPPPVRMPERVPETRSRPAPEAEPKRGSLFDTLTDPFGDDEAKVQRYRSVRPTTYLEGAPKPVARRPLP